MPIRSVRGNGGWTLADPIPVWLYIEIAADNLDREPAFEVEFPALVADGGRPARLPVIRFQRKRWAGIEVMCGP